MLASAEGQQTTHKRDIVMAGKERHPLDNIYYLCCLSEQVKDSEISKENTQASPSPTPCYRQIRGRIFQAGGRITHKYGNMADKKNAT